jgi:hypothetical protein
MGNVCGIIVSARAKNVKPIVGRSKMKPELEQLEDRLCPSQADLQAFVQFQLPVLQQKFSSIIPVVQSELQGVLNGIEAIVKTLPPLYQQVAAPAIAQDQVFINGFPILAQNWFVQQIQAYEFQLLGQSGLQIPQPVRGGGGVTTTTTGTIGSTGGGITTMTTSFPTTRLTPGSNPTSASAAARIGRQGIGVYSVTPSVTLSH